jgi:hypothetical protein
LILAGLLVLSCWCGPAFAVQEYGTIATRLVKIITVDDSGLPLGFPSEVLFDPGYQETYVYSSNLRITIYNKDFFPVGSIGVGRGVANLTGMAVSPAGKLYLSRTLYGEGQTQQSVVTIYNRALLVEREIFLDKIPGMTGFHAGGVAVAADGTIYVVGRIAGKEPVFKGAAILDDQGNFKRWLAPQGIVLRRQPPPGEEGLAGDLPDSLKPSGAGLPEADPVEGRLEMVDGVADLASVVIDDNGRVYLLSTELSEIFVYDSQGSFLHKFGVKGGAKGKLSTPRTLAVDYPRRLIYVNDFMRHTILAYDYDSGAFVYEFGGKGSSPLWYLHPESLAVDSKGRVVIADLFNRRVQVVDPTNPERPVLEPVVPAVSEAGRQLEPVDQVAGPPAAPALSVQLTGLETPVRMAAAARPARVPPRPAREIGPGRLKKKTIKAARPGISVPPPAMAPVAMGPVGLPSPMTPPPGFEAVPVPETMAGKARAKGAVKALGAVVGVYGPVAAMLGIGSWLLRRKR